MSEIACRWTSSTSCASMEKNVTQLLGSYSCIHMSGLRPALGSEEIVLRFFGFFCARQKLLTFRLFLSWKYGTLKNIGILGTCDVGDTFCDHPCFFAMTYAN